MTSKASPVTLTASVLGLLFLVAVPSLTLRVLGFDALAGDVVLACATGMIAATFGPWRPAASTSLLLGVGAAVAVLAAATPWVALVLMASCGAAMGVAARYGVAGFVSLAPIAIGFVLSEPPADPAVIVGVAYAGSAMFGAAIGSRVHQHLPAKELQPIHRSRALAYGGMLALLAGVSGWFVADLSLGHAGAWLLMTYFVVIQPYLRDGWRKAVERAAGTVIGFGIAVGLGLLIDVRWLVFTIGVIGLVVGIWVRIKNGAYWRYTVALTVGIVLAEGASSSVISTGEQRLWATVIGTGVSMAAMALLMPIYRRGADRAGIDHY